MYQKEHQCTFFKDNSRTLSSRSSLVASGCSKFWASWVDSYGLSCLNYAQWMSYNMICTLYLLYKNMFKTIRKTNSMRKMCKCSKDTLMWSAFKHILTGLWTSYQSPSESESLGWVIVVCLAGANTAMLSNLCEVQASLFLWLPASVEVSYVSPKFAYGCFQK